ncbi:MAG: alpha/beta hydrolase [Bacteroidia bacterium]|nr:alpha/beta hydrolase [Bacteroidia bacterium]
MASFDSIELKAGKAAYEAIMDGGLKPEMIKLMSGAAGGPKWIVLGHLDRYLFGEWFKGRKEALPMIGSSIGAWRFASSMAFPDPVKGLELFKEGYFGQAYSDKPTREEITAVIPQVTKEYINPDTIPHILNHPFARLFVIAVKSKGLLASENKLLQGTGLIATIIGNAMSRRNLNAFFHRVLFHDPRGESSFLGKDAFPTTEVELHKDNFEAALLATGAIPMVMEGIPNVPDAPEGMYRDGGLIDYHLTLPYQLGEGDIVFQPHFFDQVKPSWFDKKLKNRKPSEAEKNHVLLLHPSQKFIQKLPGGYVPDRKDFENFPTKERQERWEKAFDLSKEVRDDFAELVQSGKIREKLKLWE